MLINEYRQLVKAAEVAHEKAMENVREMRAEADYVEALANGAIDTANRDLAEAEQEALKEGAP